jgi:hypothetical protein
MTELFCTMCVTIHKKIGIDYTRIALVAQDIDLIIILFQTLHACIVEKA